MLDYFNDNSKNVPETIDEDSQRATNLLSGKLDEVSSLDTILGNELQNLDKSLDKLDNSIDSWDKSMKELAASQDEIRAGLARIDKVFADFDRRQAIEDAKWAEIDAMSTDDSDDDIDWSIYDD